MLRGQLSSPNCSLISGLAVKLKHTKIEVQYKHMLPACDSEFQSDFSFSTSNARHTHQFLEFGETCVEVDASRSNTGRAILWFHNLMHLNTRSQATVRLILRLTLSDCISQNTSIAGHKIFSSSSSYVRQPELRVKRPEVRLTVPVRGGDPITILVGKAAEAFPSKGETKHHPNILK